MPGKVVSFEDEKLILVDENDNAIGYENKDVCHNEQVSCIEHFPYLFLTVIMNYCYSNAILINDSGALFGLIHVVVTPGKGNPIHRPLCVV